MADEEVPAPGALGIVESFVNTIEYPGAGDGSGASPREGLGSADALARWLADADLPVPERPAAEGDLRLVRDVREAIRELVEAEQDGATDEDALETLNRAARSAHMQLVFDGDGRAEWRATAAGVDAALGRLLAIVAEAKTTGEWERMRTCGNDNCRWLFFDHSKNRSATWCGTRCGNLMKARAYRARKRRAKAGTAPARGHA